ncbi:PME family extended-spectrum class A beta-lactamase [Pseudomonas aeruginosa]|nr:PME family class A beta-lactamase [Pseudomonas aeruginosa]EKU5594787.1 PME family class A beta-lactamase [Pseudomonas aeruginosa]
MFLYFTQIRAWPLAALLLFMLAACAGAPRAPDDATDTASDALAALELRNGGRLGVFALDAGSGRSLGWREDERFGMCSTFKLLLAATVLDAARQGRLDGTAPIHFSDDDLVPHSPVLREHLALGSSTLTAPELVRATQLTSDNAAANLLIRKLGGPEAVTALWRASGDEVSRLDRLEPDMNLLPPGDLRDSTSPRAMAQHVARLFTSEMLVPEDRERLREWMVETGTGLARLRAATPPHWQAGDKTGSAIAPLMPNKTHDVAVFWPPGRAPVIVAAYYESDAHHAGRIRAQDEAVLAQVGRIAVAWAGD